MPSSPDRVREAIVRYLRLLEPTAGSPEDDLRELANVLDELATLGRNAPDVFDGDHPDPPRSDRMYHRDFASRFPMLGHYNLPCDVTSSVGKTGIMVGDAFDDLGDIAHDLSEVLWCLEHTTENDALWHFRWGYENHWGEHVSNLRWYLYAVQFEGYLF